MKLLIIFLFLILPIYVNGIYINKTVSEDTFTHNDNANTNYGTLADLYIQSRNTGAFTRSYFGFNLTDITVNDLVFYYYVGGAIQTPALDIDFYYCSDFFNEDTMTWNNQDTEVNNCEYFYSKNLNTYSISNYYKINLSSYLVNSSNSLFTIKAKTSNEVYSSSVYRLVVDSKENTNKPYINYTELSSIYELNITTPLNNTIFNTATINTSVEANFNGGNCYNYLELSNGTVENNTIADLINGTNNFTINYTFTDGNYMYWVKCNDPVSNNISIEVDMTAPIINYIFPLDGNTSIILYNGNATVNTSCTDTNLYWANFTVYYPNGTQYYNKERNISMVNTTQGFKLDIYNITDSGNWDVYTQCWDGHTDSYFKANNTEADKDIKTLTYEIGKDIVTIQLVDSNKLEEFDTLSTTWSNDRYTFDYVFKDDLRKNTYFDFVVSTNGKKIKTIDSRYNGHLIIGMDYWLDFEGVPADIEIIRLTDTKVGVKVKLTENILKDELRFKSFGGLNYNDRLAHFTVLAAPATPSNITTVNCIDCLNQSMGSNFSCNTSYTENSTLHFLQDYYCNGGEKEMSYIAIAIALVGSIILLFKLGDNMEINFFPQLNFNIVKQLIYLVAMWLILPLVNLGIVITQANPTGYPFGNTITGVYKGLMWVFVTITATYMIGLLYYVFEHFGAVEAPR